MARHLGVAIPAQDMVDATFAKDLARAVGFHAFTFPEDNISLTFYQSALIAESRNHLAKSSLEEGCDFVLFLDTDMQFPQDLFARLMQHDVPVVAANCAKRRRPISATARKENASDPNKLDAVWPDRQKTGLEQIHVVGAAVMCVKADVFMQLPFPWFDTPWHDGDQRFVGEDLFFCGQLKAHDIPLYVDHDISWAIRHVGTYAYGMDDVLAERRAAEAGMWDHIKPAPQIEVVR